MAAVERAFGVTNIKHHIPVVLDLDVFNYDAWRELFLTHCLAFDVLGHVDGTSVPQDDDDLPWKKKDGLVKLWLYGTLAPPLFKTSLALSKQEEPHETYGFASKISFVTTKRLERFSWTTTSIPRRSETSLFTITRKA
ncbi:uncharacterized protein LOC117132809 [Brassica rapa]|uniref:uncharacterized protein LOC117132809 n=1 Tax=Brassica campestris TaxID=3711 RepID=UPI00142DB43A|nr:uncharacterized protein LOC117132809 [Brassica rapa]